jgi:GTPase Era involved in 16S rRNA processing
MCINIKGVLTEPKYQLVFSDTPGMVEPVYKLQEAMMESVSLCIHRYVCTYVYKH